MEDSAETGPRRYEELPEHLHHWPGLYVRDGARIVAAPVEDQLVAKRYPAWPDKGPVTGGIRLTIMTSRLAYQTGEEVRVIHVLEGTEPGHEIYVMGPKPVHGEWVDGRLATGPPPDADDPLAQPLYDGAVLSSPAVDYNYDITSYRFFEPGSHTICWKLGALESNTLRLQVSISADEPGPRDGG
jgi:hypothetical protein